MKWGSGAGAWGNNALWGGATGTGPEDFCDIADTRVLVQMDDEASNRKFRDFICELVGPLGHYQDVLIDIRDGFDIDTAVGAQLDLIGGVVLLARNNLLDARYRDFLKIQIDLILSSDREDANWTGTVNNILTIVRTFIGAGVLSPIIYQAFPPYQFTLSIPGGLPVEEIKILFGFLCKAVYAGVNGQTIFVPAGDNVWDSDNVAVANSGIWCSANVVVANCAEWSLALSTDVC